MAKTWTVYDLSQDGPIRIRQLPYGLIGFSQSYDYLDDQGNKMDLGGLKVVDVKVQWGNIPTDIQSALTAIKNFMHTKALEQEGMTSE